MLVLTRTPGDGVVLTLPDGQRVTLTVVEIDRDKVRFGVDCPRDVPVYRKELMPFDGQKKQETLQNKACGDV